MPKQEITCLSVQQPWAELILRGVKWCENRSWETSYRGRLYIHASQRLDLSEFSVTELEKLHLLDAAELPRGKIVGHVELVDICPLSDVDKAFDKFLKQMHKQYGLTEQDDWARAFVACRGFGWIVTNPVRLPKPVPAPGKLNLWRFTL